MPPTPPPADGIVIYPVDGQKGVPVAFPGHEVPDPVPEAHGGVAGFPITASFPPGVTVRKARATLLDADGFEVEAWASSPEAPADPHRPGVQQNTVCVIAKKPLAPGCTYAVRMSAEAGGKAWARAWAFTTAAEDAGVARAAEAFLRRLNDHRKAAGVAPVSADPDLSAPCAAHARYLEQNIGQKDLNWNDEDQALPGATEARAPHRPGGRWWTAAAGRSRRRTGASPRCPRELVLDAGLQAVGVAAVAAHGRRLRLGDRRPERPAGGGRPRPCYSPAPVRRTCRRATRPARRRRSPTRTARPGRAMRRRPCSRRAPAWRTWRPSSRRRRQGGRSVCINSGKSGDAAVSGSAASASFRKTSSGRA